MTERIERQERFGLDESEEGLLLKLLAQIQGKEMSPEVFGALCRIVRFPMVELVLLRRTTTEKLEIFLTQKPADDPDFPGEWHIPGGVARLSEKSPEETLERVIREIGYIDKPIAEILMVPGGAAYSNHARGGDVHIITHKLFSDPTNQWEETEAITGGRWFPIDDLPEPFMAHHRKILLFARMRLFVSSAYMAY
jgi:8-oxo-dGTP pyrophosphatase MutT (NUDIX family)